MFKLNDIVITIDKRFTGSVASVAYNKFNERQYNIH
jgi:hypothetical protein